MKEEKLILEPEVVDEEKEKSPEDLEYNFRIVLTSADVILDEQLDREDLLDLSDEIMDKVPDLDEVTFNEDSELKIYTRFGDAIFWEQKIPEIKKVIRNFLESLSSKN